jgi:ketosteroid isomerase-like protein
MRHIVSTFILLSFVAACAYQDEGAESSDAAAPAVSTEADMQAIAAVRDLEVAAFTSGGDFSSYLAGDAVLMPPNAPRVVGIEAIGAWAAEFASQVTFNSLDYTESEIVITGDWAIERYAASVTMTAAGGDPVSGTNKGIHVYKRQADGSWKMVQDVWNSDQAN